MIKRVIRFSIAGVGCVLNLVVLSSFVFVLYFLLLITGWLSRQWSNALLSMIDMIVYRHSMHLRMILETICRVQFTGFGVDQLSQDQPFIMVINHRSHVDIMIIFAFFYDRIPNVKFFLKRSLMYVPFLGQACYLLNYIFVQKISTDSVRKNPKLVHQQREKIKKQCQELTSAPVTLAVFAEGTRFSEDKKARQKTLRFENLLSPQPAGLALAIEACAQSVDQLLDVTLVYDVGFVSVWLLLSGQVSTIEVHLESHSLAEMQLVGDYVKDRQFRKRFTDWVRYLWQRKDALMTNALARLRRKHSAC